MDFIQWHFKMETALCITMCLLIYNQLQCIWSLLQIEICEYLPKAISLVPSREKGILSFCLQNGLLLQKGKNQAQKPIWLECISRNQISHKNPKCIQNMKQKLYRVILLVLHRKCDVTMQIVLKTVGIMLKNSSKYCKHNSHQTCVTTPLHSMSYSEGSC